MKKWSAIAAIFVLMIGYQNCGSPESLNMSENPKLKVIRSAQYERIPLDERYDGLLITSQDRRDLPFAFAEVIKNEDGNWNAQLFSGQENGFPLSEKVNLHTEVAAKLDEYFMSASLCKVILQPVFDEPVVCTMEYQFPYANLIRTSESAGYAASEPLDEKASGCSVGNDLCDGLGSEFKSFLQNRVLTDILRQVGEIQNQ
jgi:hypothetical protein